MSRAIELIEHVAGIEALNAAALQAMTPESDEAKALVEHFAEQATKKTIAFANIRKLMQEELEAAAAAAPAQA